MYCKNCKQEKDNPSRFFPVVCHDCFKLPKVKDKFKDYLKAKEQSRNKQFPKK